MPLVVGRWIDYYDLVTNCLAQCTILAQAMALWSKIAPQITIYEQMCQSGPLLGHLTPIYQAKRPLVVGEWIDFNVLATSL